MGLSERQLLLALVALAFLMGIVGLTLTGGPSYGGGVYVESYSADLYLNGTLFENFRYQVNEAGTYRMFYRSWNAPLSFDPLDSQYVKPLWISSPSGTLPYAVDFQGDVHAFENAPGRPHGRTDEIASLAERNEAGVYQPDYFKEGLYDVAYAFQLYPPLECDDSYCHLNLQLAKEHLAYRNVTLAIHDPNGDLARVFSHPPMDSMRQGDTLVLTGESPENSLLEVEILLKPEASRLMTGFPSRVEDVEEKTVSANADYYGKYSLFSYLSEALRALMLLFPALIVLLYYWRGSERGLCSAQVPILRSCQEEALAGEPRLQGRCLRLRQGWVLCHVARPAQARRSGDRVW
jgi:uncharacterized membrane protein